MPDRLVVARTKRKPNFGAIFRASIWAQIWRISNLQAWAPVALLAMMTTTNLTGVRCPVVATRQKDLAT
jgi:hypothetical protein